MVLRLLVATCLVATGWFAASAGPADGAEAPPSALRGRVVDASTGSPVPGAQVRFVEGGSAVVTDEQGTFTLGVGDSLRQFAGHAPLHVSVRAIGFKPREVALSLEALDASALVIRLVPAPISIPGIEIEEGAASLLGEEQQPVSLRGQALDEAQARTIADVLAGEAGIDVRSLGPAPARPVLRGHSGGRILVLQDGARPGDLSASAADHAVAIEPLQADRVTVIRGPAALQFAPNVIAGVVDVRRDAVPTDLPDGWHGSLGLQAETVSEGLASGLRLGGALGPFAAQLGLSARGANDLTTPVGVLGNTNLAVQDGALGVSWIGGSTSVGVAAARYESEYGVPGGFLGGHPNGADIDLERSQYDLLALHRPTGGALSELRLAARATRYFHRELESNGNCGVSFGLLRREADARVGWGRAGDPRGSAGVRFDYEDHASGCLSFTPPTLARSAATYAYQELRLGSMDVSIALRLDGVRLSPAESDTNKAGVIREREFVDWSGGVGAWWSVGADWRLGANLLRALRIPSVEDLYAEGPHLAAYAYEVGNADLPAEVGYSGELIAHRARRSTESSVTLFYNWFPSYLISQDTGELEWGAGEGGYLVRYQMASVPARLMGGEATGTWQANSWLAFDAAASLVRGTYAETGDPLPQIPPVSGRLGARLSTGPWSVRGVVHAASAQTRVDAFEDPTAGWITADAQVGWRLVRRGLATDVILTLENLADAEYRRHLNRVRSIMPEAGRNWRLLFRLLW